MPGLNLKVENKTPIVDIDPKLLVELAHFEFDHDLFKEGLELAGAPAVVSDSLKLNFTASQLSNVRTDSWYFEDDHILNFEIGKGAQTRIRYATTQPWEGHPDTLTTGLNYSFAYHASRIADVAIRHPETLAGKKRDGKPDFQGRLWALMGSTTTGAIVGSQVAESTGYPVWVGGLMGAGGGFAADVLVLAAMNSAKDLNDEFDKAQKSIHQRALNFANSDEAAALFSGVAAVELV